MKKKRIDTPDFNDYLIAPSVSSVEVIGLVSDVYPADEFLGQAYVAKGVIEHGDPADYVNGAKKAHRLGKVADYFFRLVRLDHKMALKASHDALPTVEILDLMTRCPDAAPEFLNAYAEFRRKSFGPHVGWEGFDPGEACYSRELDIAFTAWRAVSTKHNNRDPIKKQIEAWIRSTYPDLLDAQVQRIATVVNWEKAGGRPSTE